MGAVSFKSIECLGYRVTYDDEMVEEFEYSAEGANDLVGSLRPGIYNIEIVAKAHANWSCLFYDIYQQDDTYGMSIFPAKRFMNKWDKMIYKEAKKLSKRRHCDYMCLFGVCFMPLELA